MIPTSERDVDTILQTLRAYVPSESVDECVQPVFVDTVADMQNVALPMRQAHVMGLDTEFIRETTFYPQLAVLQMSLPQDDNQYVLDVLSIPKEHLCYETLFSPDVIKILHGCSEDVEIFYLQSGQVLSPIFDTQVAAALLGARVQTGYDALVEGVLGAKVDKSETRSDWTQRPLSDQQLRYAATDVRYLLPLYETLNQALLDKGRRHWLDDEMAQSAYALTHPGDPAYMYQRVNQHWRLRGRELYVLQQLCVWRETHVRSLNIPRNFLVSDAALWAIAHRAITTQSRLKGLKELKPIQWRKYGEDLLEAINTIVAAAPPDAGDLLPVKWPQPKKYRDIVKIMKGLVEQRAVALGIDPSLLLGKRLMLSFLNKAEKQYRRLGTIDVSQLSGQPWLQGWRQSVILVDLAKPLERWLANHAEQSH